MKPVSYLPGEEARVQRLTIAAVACDFPHMHEHKKQLAEALKRGLTFRLEYYTDFGPRSIEGLLLRHRSSDPEEPDSFSVKDAESGRTLGAGDTKDEALREAQIRLHQWADFGIALPPAPET